MSLPREHQGAPQPVQDLDTTAVRPDLHYAESLTVGRSIVHLPAPHRQPLGLRSLSTLTYLVLDDVSPTVSHHTMTI